MRALLILPLVLAALAGCSDDNSHDDTVTCPDGTTVDLADVPEHHDEAFDPMSVCAPPALVVHLQDVPASRTAWQTATVSFDFPLGERARAHSMDNQVRVARQATAVGPDDGPDTYGEMVARREHQDLPVSFEHTIQFPEVGMYYIRGYGVVEGVHHWSDEHVVEVGPVAPTGDTVTVVHGPGESLGTLEPADASMVLGDELVFQNDDLVAHVFTFTSGPLANEEVSVAAGASSDPILMEAPGTYEVTTDDQQPKTATLRVTVA